MFGALRLGMALAPGKPTWWLNGSTLDLDFRLNRGRSSGVSASATSFLTTTRASTSYADTVAGAWTAFASNVPRQTDKGLLVEEARTNLFLTSGVPATQSVTVVAATVYTVSVIGTGSVTLSGAGTGTASQGSPVTFTAGSTSLTLTTAGITGVFVNLNSEAGSFATSPIVTAGASATRPGDVVTTPLAGTTVGAAVIYGRTAPGVSASNQALWQWDNATSNERLSLYRTNARNLIFEVTAGGVTQAFFDLGVVADNTDFKVAISWAVNNFLVSLNGAAASSDVSGTVPTGLTTIRHGADTGGSQWGGRIYREVVFPAAKTAAEVQALAA